VKSLPTPEGAIMERLTPILSIMAVLLFVGVNTLLRFSHNLFHYSQNVRMVDVVGLSGGGAACGAAIFGVIFVLMLRNKR
jgi:hypothetical protein